MCECCKKYEISKRENQIYCKECGDHIMMATRKAYGTGYRQGKLIKKGV